MVKTKYQPICEKMCESYFDILINRLYKILPLKEEGSLTVDKYIESLLSEMTGGREMILMLHEDGQYLSIMNSLEFIRTCENVSVCKREIFRCIRIIEKLKQKYF